MAGTKTLTDQRHQATGGRATPRLEKSFEIAGSFRNALGPFLERALGYIFTLVSGSIGIYMAVADQPDTAAAAIDRLTRVADWLIVGAFCMSIYIICQDIVSTWRRSKMVDLQNRVDELERALLQKISVEAKVVERFKTLERLRSEFDAYLMNVSDRTSQTIKNAVSEEEKRNLLLLCKTNAEALTKELGAHLEKVCLIAVEIINEIKGVSQYDTVAVNIKVFAGSAAKPRYTPIVRVGRNAQLRLDHDRNIDRTQRQGCLVKSHYCYKKLFYEETGSKPYFVVPDRELLSKSINDFYSHPNDTDDHFYRSSIVTPIKGPLPSRYIKTKTPYTELVTADGAYKGLICVDHSQPRFFNDVSDNNPEASVMQHFASHVYNVLKAFEVVLTLNVDIEEKLGAPSKKS